MMQSGDTYKFVSHAICDAGDVLVTCNHWIQEPGSCTIGVCCSATQAKPSDVCPADLMAFMAETSSSLHYHCIVKEKG